jgi:nucleoside-diphosphate-sugar epimerase
MSETEKPHRFIVIGKGGGFSQEIVRQIHPNDSKNASYNLSTREINSRDSQNQISTILTTQDQFNDTILWCAGSSSNRSNISDCNKDETKLREFMDTVLSSSNYTPNVCYLSSGGTVYGKSPGVVSEISPLNPQSAYAEMKIHSEEFLLRVASSGRIGVCIFRIANVYGSAHSSNRMSFVQAALTNPEIFLTVNSLSRKQYGTYQDYSSFILKYLDKFPLIPGSKLIQNVYSEHSYSISEILEVTHPYGAFKDRRVIRELESLTEYENVHLTSVNSGANLNIRWRSLEDYLRTVD